MFFIFNVFTICTLSNKDKLHISRLHGQVFGTKAVRASYPDKNCALDADDQRGCLVHFARLTNTLLKDKESA